MTSLVYSIGRLYNYLFDELSHPLTKDWLLVRSPIPVLLILISYNVFCTKIGPALMKNRPPYKLDLVIMLYNIFQVIINLYIFNEGRVYIFSGNFNFKCQGIGPDDLRLASGIHLYVINKLIDLLDTIFFVLRKSDRQITFLHLYHHTLMSAMCWWGLKYFPGGQGAIFGTINSLVHVVMYTYYFISGLGPQYQKYLWWKKYLTVMQIVQFVIVFLHSFNSLFYSCSFSPILKVMTIIFAGIFLHMFGKFYYYTYIVKRKGGKDKVQISIANVQRSKEEDKDSNGKPISDRNSISKDLALNGNSRNKY